ncbi:MAG: hypothetical protein Q9169_007038 [Polycauliona sp. 2 TL-2023]
MTQTQRTPCTQFSKTPCILIPRDQHTDQISIWSSLNAEEESGLIQSPLNRLPLEIRQEIWGYVLGREENTIVLIPTSKAVIGASAAPELSSTPSSYALHCHDSQYHFRRHHSADIPRYCRFFWPNRPAILRTRRRSYCEAVELLYSGNSFVFNELKIAVIFSEVVVRRRVDAVRMVRVDVDLSDYWPGNILSQGGNKGFGGQEVPLGGSANKKITTSRYRNDSGGTGNEAG